MWPLSCSLWLPLFFTLPFFSYSPSKLHSFDIIFTVLMYKVLALLAYSIYSYAWYLMDVLIGARKENATLFIRIKEKKLCKLSYQPIAFSSNLNTLLPYNKLCFLLYSEHHSLLYAVSLIYRLSATRMGTLLTEFWTIPAHAPWTWFYLSCSERLRTYI